MTNGDEARAETLRNPKFCTNFILEDNGMSDSLLTDDACELRRGGADKLSLDSVEVDESSSPITLEGEDVEEEAFILFNFLLLPRRCDACDCEEFPELTINIGRFSA